MKTNTIRHRGRSYRILHTCNGGTSFPSAIIAAEAHAERILEIIVCGKDLSEYYKLVPAPLEERGIVYQPYEIRTDNEGDPVAGYWDFPLLERPPEPDAKTVELLERLMEAAERMENCSPDEIIENNCDEIIVAQEDADALSAIFGVKLPLSGDGRMRWIREEYAKKNGWGMETDFPEVERSELNEEKDIDMEEGLSDNERDELVIRRNPAMDEYYKNPITEEDLAAASCSKPSQNTGFAARLGRRMVKKGFMRRGRNDPCYMLPEKKEEPARRPSKFMRRFVRQKRTAEVHPSPAAEHIPEKPPVPVLTRPIRHTAEPRMVSRFCKRPLRRRKPFTPADVPSAPSSFLLALPQNMPIGPPGFGAPEKSASAEYG